MKLKVMIAIACAALASLAVARADTITLGYSDWPRFQRQLVDSDLFCCHSAGIREGLVSLCPIRFG